MLIGDAATESVAKDAFGFSSLAKEIARNVQKILHRANAQSFVLGIEGPWGSGKTTLVEFVKSHIDEDESDISIVHFDPWWFSRGDDLKATILREIFSSLPIRSNSRLSRFAAILSEKVSSTPSSIDAALKIFEASKPFGEALEALREAAGDADRLFSRSMPARSLRDGLSAAMKKSGQRVVVIIDDLDRLDHNEMRDVLDAIRTIGDIPSILYILCYDSKNVSQILENSSISNGHKYIEKIVNLSIEMPIQSTHQLKDFLLGLIDEEARPIISGPDAEGHLSAILALLDTPREAVRLANAFNFWVGSKLEETYPPDALLLEALRLIHPHIPGAIMRLAAVWFGRNSFERFGLNKDEDEITKSRIAFALASDGKPADPKVLNAVSQLFPRFAKIIDPDHGHLVRSSPPSEARPISNKFHFYTYFFHRPLPGLPPKSLLQKAFFSQSIDTRKEALAIIAAMPPGDIRPIYAAFAQLTEELESNSATDRDELLASIVAGGDSLTPHLRRHPEEFAGEDWLVKETLRLCVEGLKSPAETAIRIHGLASDPYLLGWSTVFLTSGTDLYPFKEESEKIVDVPRATLETLRERFSELFWVWWEDGRVFSIPSAPHLYTLARKWSPQGVVEEKFRSIISTKSGIERLLGSYIGFGAVARSIAEDAGLSVEELKSIFVDVLDAETWPESQWPISIFSARH